MLDKYSVANYFESNQDLEGGYLHRINADNHHQNLKCLEKGKRTPVSCVRKVQGSYPLRAMINTGAILSNQQNCLLISQRRLKMSQNLTTSIVQQFQNLQLIVTPDSNHGFFMTTEQVAKGYGVSDKSIQNHKIRNANEILENTHFISDLQIVGLKNGMTKKRTLWTKRGVIRLGMFIKSGRAIKFRDWAENLIIEKLEPKSIKPKRPALPQGSDFRKNSDGIYYYEPMTQYGRIPVGILHGINTAAQTFVTEAVIKEALRRRIKMCEKKLASEFWLKLGKESLKTHDTTGEALYRLLEVDRELSIGNLEIAMSDIFRTYWE